MKILFTGGSSFTGYWFVKELAAAGHDVSAMFRRKAEDYADDLRRSRVWRWPSYVGRYLACPLATTVSCS